tara:strand:+ start:767 stop:1048 length:282 start_codon:yes stop_codon:yes gene_type:complete
MSITKLSESIFTLTHKNNLGKMLLLGQIQNQWEKIVGPAIKEATSVVKIEKGTIYIKCKNPTWKNELFYQKTELLKKIKEETPKNTIKKIYLI